MHSKKQLTADLIALGIRQGDCVLMHSSYKALGGIEGGAGGLFDVFTDLLGSEGTLILPTLSYEAVNRENPRFDVVNTPSCVGYLTSFFMKELPGAVRSLHATHSCAAWGKLARPMTDGHINDTTPVGANSPFRKLPEVGGKILCLGSHPDHNTSMHGVEETVPFQPFIDYSRQVEYEITGYDGEKTIVPSYRHHFERTEGEYVQKYSRILDLLDDDEVSYGRVLDAECVLMDAEAVWTKGHDKLLEDPFFFVDWVQYT